MKSDKSLLLSTTMIPLLVLGGVASGGMVLTGQFTAPPVRAACSPCSPCAATQVKNPCNPCAAASPCNPCAAANPCAAVNPCNPCSPCNPCAAGGGSSVTACAVPRLQSAAAANPCAAAKPCAPCAAANPCNPCAAANPCAAVNPCSPCAAANPCNPCAAANPCAANPCNPCNPCAAAGAAGLTDEEAVAAYDCLLPTMTAAYAKSDRNDAGEYADWRRYSTQPYVSATHGSRYVQNYANAAAKGYGNYENAGTFPPGARLGKDSFMVNDKGEVSVGPLFLMEKMEAGFNPDSDDWRYTMIMPNGAVFGTTKGQGAENVGFCIECHKAVAPDQDSVMLLPDEYRVK